MVTCLLSAQHYLGIGVTHHSNQEVKEKDDKQCNEEEPVDFPEIFAIIISLSY